MTREEFRKAKWSYGIMVRTTYNGKRLRVVSVDFENGMVTVYIDRTLQLVCDYNDLEIVEEE